LRRAGMKKLAVRELVAYIREQDVSVEVWGDQDTQISGFSSLKHYHPGSITWIKGQANADLCKVKLTAVVCPPDVDVDAEVKLITNNPKDVFFMVIDYLDDCEAVFGIAKTAVLGKNVQIGERVFIGEYCCIGDHVQIGDDTRIEAHVVLHRNVRIGKRCVVKAGAVIGGDGFGYSKRDHSYHKVSHHGGVVVGDDVDIGSNTCIDRGTIEDTVIGDGVKIDNLCHIAHNVTIGSHSCIIANSTICGSVFIGQWVYIAPNSVIRNQVRVEDKAMLGMGSGAVSDITRDTVNIGFPAKAIRTRTEADWKKY